MRQLIFLIALVMGLTASAGTMILEGKYQGKNLYVVNSVSASGVGYCVFEVLVNGNVSSDEWNSPAFEVDLSIHGLSIGDDLVIAIKYKEGCLPKVINPSILEPQPTFEIVDMSVSKSGLIDWTTTGESGSLPYIVQQFKWNKWVRIGEIEGKGTPGKNSYSFQAVEVSGTNKFRVIQKNSNGVFKSSNSVQFQSFKEDVTVVYDKKQSALKFSSETNFELYNIYGQIVKRGFGSEVDLAAFRKDEYYINFDNQSEKFFKK